MQFKDRYVEAAAARAYHDILMKTTKQVRFFRDFPSDFAEAYAFIEIFYET